MIVNEDAIWDWEKQDVVHVSVPMSFEENPRTTEEEEEVTASPSLESQVESGFGSTEMISGSTSAGSQSVSPSSTLVKLRDIAEIYARCNISINEL